MSSQRKTKAQLIQEIGALQARLAEIERCQGPPSTAEGPFGGRDGFVTSLIDALPVFLAALDSEAKVLTMNRVMLDALGYTIDEVVGQDYLSTFVPEADRALLADVFQRLTRTDAPTHNENRVLTKQGRELLVSWHGRSVFREGTAQSFYGLGTDITEQRRAEEAQRRRNTELASLNAVAEAVSRSLDLREALEAALGTVVSVLDAAGGIVFLYDEDRGVLVLAAHHEPSQAVLAELTELRMGEGLTGQVAASGEALVVADLRADPRGRSPAAVREGYRAYAGVPIMSKHRVLGVMALVSREPGFFGPHQVDLLTHVGQQIGVAVENAHLYQETRRAEQALQREHDLVTRVMETSPAGIAVLDREGRITFANASAERVLGLSREGITQRTYNAPEWHITDYGGGPLPDDQLPFRQAMATGRAVHDVRHAIQWPDGRRVLLSVNAAPLFGASGEIEGVVALVENVTERVQSAEALRRSEARYRSLVEHIPAVTYRAALDESSTTTYISPQVKTVLGYSQEDFLSDPNTWDKSLHPDDRARVLETVTRCHASGEKLVCEYRVIRSDGTVGWLHDEGAIVRNDAGEPLFLQGVTIDITQRKQAEAELQRLATAVEQAAEAIIITDADAAIQYVNPAFEHITGYARDEAVGRNPRFLKSGEQDDVFYSRMWVALTTGQVWRGHLVNRRKDGSLYHEEATISPVRDASGSIVNYVAVKRDVTQEHAIEEQWRQSQKMEAIGQLAGGLAHDFNNLLTGVLGYANMLKLGAQPGEGVYEAADVIERAAQRAAELTDQLLGFARRGKHQNIPVDMHGTIHDVIGLLGRTLHKNIHVMQQLGAAWPWVLGDPGQMQQVLLNLAVNARDAMPEGGKLAFETDALTVGEASHQVHADLTPGPYLVLSVRDTGVGIPEAHRGRLFEPFFTTKGPAHGTGMGLPMVYGIVRNHGGAVDVHSEVGVGTTFKVYLPLALDVAVATLPADTDSLIRGTGRVLVVDDEEVVRNVATAMLRHLGYQVVTARDGREAVHYYQQHGHEIDLVILDMIMPELDGRACFGGLKQIDPNVKAVLSTGYSLDSDVQGILDEGMLGLALKPYRIGQLSKVVADALGIAPPTGLDTAQRC